MKKLVAFFNLALLVMLGACTDQGTSSPAQSDSVVVDSVKFQQAASLIHETKAHLDARRAENTLFIKPVNVERAYGEALFYGGKILAVSWREDPVDPLVTVYFDEKEEVAFYSLYSQGSDYFSEVFYTHLDDEVMVLERSGYFGQENYPFSVIAYDNWAREYLNEHYNVEYIGQLFHATAARLAKSEQGTNYYTGRINNALEIWLRLNRNGDWAMGDYRYIDSESSLGITAEFESDRVIITEKDGEFKTGEFVGIISKEGNIEGEWKSANDSKVLPFYLERIDHYKLTSGEMLLSVQNTKPVAEELVLNLDLSKMPYDVKEQLKKTLQLSAVDVIWAGLPTMMKLDSFVLQTAFFQERIRAWSFDHQGREIHQRYFASIYNALPASFVNRHLGYYNSELDNYEEEERLLAAVVYCVDRSEDNIKRWWKYFQNNWSEPVLKGYFSAYDTTAVQLMSAYEFLKSQKGIEMKMEDVYAAIDSMDQNKNQHIIGAAKYVGALEDQRFFLAEIMPPNQEEALWAYSFWMRRFHEGNHETVYEILKEAYATVITAEHEYD